MFVVKLPSLGPNEYLQSKIAGGRARMMFYTLAGAELEAELNPDPAARVERVTESFKACLWRTAPVGDELPDEDVDCDVLEDALEMLATWTRSGPWEQVAVLREQLDQGGFRP